MQRYTGSPVFRYRFEQAPPAAPNTKRTDELMRIVERITRPKSSLSSERSTPKSFPGTMRTPKVSDLMSSYWANFEIGRPERSWSSAMAPL